MLTPKQRRFLQALHQHLKDNPQHGFVLRRSHGTDRLVLRFPYGSHVKDSLAKDRKNFDYQINAIFNAKLREAMALVVYLNSLFPDATEMTKKLVVEKMRRGKQEQ
ncbi:MAG: hypothetical protein V2A73_00800 [Pseudomonadota bacterium]